MKIKELKQLVEYGAIGQLLVTSYGDGWALAARKKGDVAKDVCYDSMLETARGGIREFKTLDAIAALANNELNHHKFTVF